MKQLKPCKIPLLVGVVAAAGWAVAHLFIQLPRGWPFFGPGEWDVLLVAEAVAAGRPPHAIVAALHGYELGVYLVAAPVALLRMLGVPMLLAAKITAMLFGAGTVGLAAGLATSAAHGVRGRGGLVAGGLAAWMLIVVWPDWHAVAANLDGSTRHAALPQLAAVACMLAAWRRDSLKLSAASGAFAGIAWFISTVSLWTLFLALGTSVLIAVERGRARGIRHAAVVVGGVGAWVALYGLVIPGGFVGVEGFLMAHPSWIGPVFSGSGGPPSARVVPVGPLELVRHVPSSLLGMGGVAPTPWIRWLSGGTAALVLGFAFLRGAYAGVARRLDGLSFLAVVASSWLIPLSYLPETYRFYAPAYRFWAIPLCLGFVVLAVQAEVLWAAVPRARVLRYGLVTLLVLVSLPSLVRIGETVDFPQSSLTEGLVHAGMHRMGRRLVGTHTTYWELSPHAPTEGEVAVDQGYGLQMGFELAEELHSDWEADEGWTQLTDGFEPRRQHSILLGVGCGLGATLPEGESVRIVVSLFSGVARGRFLSGVVRCALRQETAGGSADRSGLIAGLALDTEDWGFVARALQTSSATPEQRGNWLAGLPVALAGDGPEAEKVSPDVLAPHEDLLPETFRAYPVAPPP